jgi:superfamily II DNA/RNA helicase
MDRIKVTAVICSTYTKTIIFCRTKRGADRLVEQLEKEGVRAAAIHGDLRQSQREAQALADFGAGKLPVLVATDVAARRTAHRRRRCRDSLRSAGRSQGVPTPLRPHRSRRIDGHRCFVVAVEPNGRSGGHHATPQP